MLLRQIKYFVTIVDCNSFTEAAEKCFISQSAISQQISALESELKVQLIKRENRKFSLTPAGEYFYKSGKAILYDVDEMQKETVRIGSDNELHLNIGYLAGYDGAELPEAIMEFSKIYPEVIVTVFKGTHEDLYHALRDGKAHLALNDQRRAFSDEYENFILSQSPAYIDVSASHLLATKDTVTLDELNKYPCILVATKGTEQIEQEYYSSYFGIGKQFIFAESLDEARLMAMSGRGYILVESVKNKVREPLVRKEIRRNDLSPIVRTYCAFWKKNRTNYYIEEFAALLRKKFNSEN
ncbi:MAG: LysR family transcriptional regulator [Clostridiales bacterium]|nr:LysR family transcriptional regulator [Clostridiales bacterium]